MSDKEKLKIISIILGLILVMVILFFCFIPFNSKEPLFPATKIYGNINATNSIKIVYPGTYTLKASGYTPTTGFNISASNTILDGKNYTLTYTGNGTTYALIIDSNNVKVQNLHFVGFYYGIYTKPGLSNVSFANLSFS